MAEPDADCSSRAFDRAVVPAVGKALELGLVVLFVTLVTTALYGGIVPDYRTAAADRVADRTLAAAGERVEGAVPPNATRVRSERRVDLPTSIRGSAYRIEADGRALVLEHPADGVGGRLRLALPSAVVSVSGAWDSGADAAVVVRSGDGGLAVELQEAEG